MKECDCEGWQSRVCKHQRCRYVTATVAFVYCRVDGRAVKYHSVYKVPVDINPSCSVVYPDSTIQGKVKHHYK